ncbi:Formamidopyrimidine-DNA glycosylase N-terminal domain-containing protein [Podospora aff. communis PSN243]|uniref:Formamidopyrimidine-DNA glycosylase N-terminal domain-containing protein n=1 Tax=Podospora aff. communis PSN243 TaxID=3040156 RepID=A0AAV9GYJ8_9PEZI|nr:Formamidopyrimidine-DNA glycosylase N-terminal domain-containing protein [Podospora aff. communis PSN243]
MPEIAEIARIVHFLRAHLVGKTVKNATAIEDANVFGKVGTTGAEVAKALKGRKVVSSGNQGKYFWIVLDKPPHLVMHFGMTGWIHIKGEQTAYTNYYKKMKPEEVNAWPPKFWKFHLETEQPAVSVAFTDPRRFGRVRLVDCPGESIRKHSPLVENGPDPVVDAEIFTVDFLKKKMKARHVPIKALLLDQTTISGIGNWVGDEVLFQAKMHPEQYCDDFSDEQIETLHKAIRYVCQLAVDKLGDSDEFPKDWMFHVRWGKGSKDAVSHLPSGEKLAFLTVGGRTSCYAPAIQKKTGKVVPGVKEEPLESGEDKPKPKKAAKSKAKAAKEVVKEEESEEEKPRKRKKVVEEDEKPAKRGKAEVKPKPRANGSAAKEKASTKANVEPKAEPKVEDGRRRSGRLQKSEKSDYFD